ncbi:hypothetical protein [Roseicitreum antarcticum]|uniref:Uncharacterized protein n=1 Tax=Roseicitreum antarcticum TaxID=564137 RepID=A0A1H3DAQ3_9RHOB|nr:hypothetical protein [Roseicitreum antarcticum]SDX63437.1 hypothetical protein SAMN04488238_11255 [Roseicitreum antarcticum]
MIRNFGVLALLGTAFALSSCGPRTIDYAYRADTTLAQHDRDSLQCEVEATQRIVPNIQTRRTPVIYTPVQTTCQQIGTQTQCTTTGGEWQGGDAYSVDVNEDLRGEVQVQCMRDRGYQIVPLPSCPSRAVTDEARTRLTDRLFAPVPDACAVQITQRGSNVLRQVAP